MNNREAHYYLEELQRMMTQHRGIFSEEFVCAIGMAIQALEKAQEQRWIPVSERPPEEYGNYLVSTSRGYVVEDYYASYGWDDDSDMDYVIAWMPRPKPYKEEQE